METQEIPPIVRRQLDQLLRRGRALAVVCIVSLAAAIAALLVALLPTDRLTCNQLTVHQGIRTPRLSTGALWLEPGGGIGVDSADGLPFGPMILLTEDGETLIACRSLRVRPLNPLASLGAKIEFEGNAPSFVLLDSDGRSTARIQGGTEPRLELVLGDPAIQSSVVDGSGFAIEKAGATIARFPPASPK